MPSNSQILHPETPPLSRDSAFNIAASREKSFFMQMVSQLVQTVEEPPYSGRGRPPLSLRKTLSDLFCKVHDQRPSRQATSDLYYYDDLGIRNHHVPHFNSLTKYLRDPRLTPLLYGMLIMTSHPMRDLETVAAVDSTGFIARPPGHWNGVKHGCDNESSETRARKRRRLRRGRKVHVVSGVRSNTIMAVTITPINDSDHDELPELIDQTLAFFKIRELLGDNAYMSHKHYEMLGDLGIIPFLDFNSNVKMPPLDGSMWSRMFHLYSFHEDIWDAHYYLRNNGETTFSMVKGHWGEIVLSRDEVAQDNEILLKLVCHNIWVLNKQSVILRIDPLDFGVEVKPLPDLPTNGTNGFAVPGNSVELPSLLDLPFHSISDGQRPGYLCFCDDCIAREINRPFPFSQN